jgi:hypothetical protein
LSEEECAQLTILALLTSPDIIIIIIIIIIVVVVVVIVVDRLCDLVVRVPGYESRGLGSIPGATRFSEKYLVWNGVHSAS